MITIQMLVLHVLVLGSGSAESQGYASHEPLRRAPPPASRPLETGPRYFADPQRGDDAAAGTETAPWRTIQHALNRLQPGDTLYLRGGVYYENVQARLAGRPGKPITIGSFPGELAVLDGGLREFFESPGEAWSPFDEGAAGEFRSLRAYPNLRHVLGCFGDSLIGLHAYYHARDLRSTQETIGADEASGDIQPLYCGPGLWYDRESGRIHVRLAHTGLPQLENYRGETDPRKLPLILAPFRSLPLHLDGAEHLRWRDLIIRGAGYHTALLEQSSNLEFDNVTFWCGTFGMTLVGVRNLRITRCGFYGSAPPWATRHEAGLNTYPGRKTRDITRLNTHALLVADANREFSVYAYPFNDDWEIAYCDFADSGSDGLYLGGVNLKFHHNRIEGMRDDGVYLSPMYPRHFYPGLGAATLRLYQNFFSGCLTVLAYGGTETVTQDRIYFYRNVIDLRAAVPTARPSAKNPADVSFNSGKVTGDHGSPPWPSLFAYQNTFFTLEPWNGHEMWLARGAAEQRPRRLFNNILVHGARLPGHSLPENPHAHVDANLYWQPGFDPAKAGTYFQAYRASPAFENSKKVYPDGFEAHSLVADPKFLRGDPDPKTANDYRLDPGSPAIDAGIDLPADWSDPLRERDAGRPDLGALPLGAAAFQAGREAAPEGP
ncbi:MAG: hypothetical protein HYU36_21125 [Planctomycetes bacterium]|nr:hypothetical protein [Planctomycetota bacterium]